MRPRSQRPYLRVVNAVSDGQVETSPTAITGSLAGEPRQSMLFSDASLHTLGFIKAADFEAEKFESLIKDAKPRIIFDLRPVPGFARGTLPRRNVFALFARHDVTYFDVAGVLGVSGGRDALLNPVLLIDALQVNILRSAKRLIGPIFFFVNDDLFYEEYFSSVAKHLPHVDGRGWDIACWPNEAATTRVGQRNLVFVSHANPEDNDVALWLATRLAARGYQVWSDVTRLLGGEIIWDSIEEAIRVRAAKVIVLLSRRGHQKPGLLDEVNVAVATERSEALTRFVIPLRIDDLPFGEIRANLARKNVIDGSENLASALARILTIFREDHVFAEPGTDASWLERAQVRPLVQAAHDEWSVLYENKLEVVAWPKSIRKFRDGAAASRGSGFPTHPVAGGIVTFEDWNVIAQTIGGHVQRIGEAVFDLSHNSNALALVFSDRAEAVRATAALLRQAWDRACQTAGLEPFVLANNNACWFLRSGFQNANRVHYRNLRGVERQKALVGRSPRRGVYWHFAIEARPSVFDGAIRVVPHVVFSIDGRTPLGSQDRQHALRRSFCRNWWNSRWRDLLSAMLSHIAAGSETISLPVSQNNVIKVSARLTAHLVGSDGNADETDVSRRRIVQFDEPKVAVGFRQTTDYPKEGLLLFGPVAFERNPKVVRVGVIGTKEGIELFRLWSRRFNKFQDDPALGRNTVPFPGFEAVFGTRWSVNPVHVVVLSRTDLINNILMADRHQAIFRCSGMYVDAVTKAVRDDDVGVDIWYVVIPDEVYVYGRPRSRVPSAIAIATPGAMGRQAARRFSSVSPSLFPEDNEEALIYDHHLDFHHQLKARLLGLQAVTQVLRESSLAAVTADIPPEMPVSDDLGSEQEEAFQDEDIEPVGNALLAADPSRSEVLTEGEWVDDSEEILTGESSGAAAPIGFRRQMQDRASVAWNLATTTFFKAGGRPWRVASARAGVCYIGLIFKRDPNMRSRQACCGAQMFLQDSDGLVFKGAMGPWYSPETGQFHLVRSEAHRLISKVLQSYCDDHADAPRELFIHGRTRFTQEEWAGFCDAVCRDKTRLVGVRISRSNEYKLFSNGELAVRRGTAIYLSPRVGLLWTSGFVERLGTYPGRETPNPLRVEITHDTARASDIRQIMLDIMMLTKMNFNSCIYGDGLPVTMRFADAIGDVLVTARDKDVPPLPFRYYI